MKRLIYSIVTFFFVFTAAYAQMSVKSFEELPFDLDASTHYPKKDANNQQCAIIKIFTTQKGFSFDNGTLGIVDVDYDDVKHAAEIWVYVPESTMKLKISHPQLGHIQNSQYNDGFYWFPRVKAGKCYKMELTSGTVRTVVEEAKQKTGWLVVNSTPPGANVYIKENGEEKHYGVTPFNKKMPYGHYTFRLKKNKYHDELCVADIKDTRLVLDIPLRPAFGSLSLTSNPSGAQVFIDDENTGKSTPCTFSELTSGSHTVMLQMADYAPAMREVIINDAQTTEEIISLEARFAKISITSLSGASIKINGEAKGVSNFSDNLLEGLYDIEVSLANHRSVNKQIEVEPGVPQMLELNPIPIYGSLDVTSVPFGANISINGKSYGDTPTTIDNLLTGEYDVVLSKPGCATVTEHVTISENATASINATLPSGRSVTIATDKSGDEIFVDGTRMGVTPLTTELTFGNHEVVAQRGKERATKKINVSDGYGALAVRLGFGFPENDGTFIVNEHFTSSSSLWKQSKGNLSFKDGKCVFADMDNYGYSEITYNLPKNLKNEDFQLTMSIKITFNELYSALFFYLGNCWDDSYQFGIAKYSDKTLAFRFGDKKDSDKYGYSTDSNLAISEAHQYTMIKKGKKVEWYIDGKLLFSKNIKLSIDMHSMGFLVPSRHIIEIDYLTIKQL